MSTSYDSDTGCYTYECKSNIITSEYTVTFKNSDTKKCTPASGEKSCTVDAPKTATCGNGSFVGWSTSSSGTTVSYAAGSKITVRASQTMYPVCKSSGLGGTCSKEYGGSVSRKTDYKGCNYYTIMWDGQPGTTDEKEACCSYYGYTFVSKGGLDYEYCISCSGSGGNGGNGGGGNNSDTPSGNPSNNPKTGSALIYFVWGLGLLMIGYSVWYFKNGIKE